MKFGPGRLLIYSLATFQTESRMANKIQNGRQNPKWPIRNKKWSICILFYKIQSNQLKAPIIAQLSKLASATGNLVFILYLNLIFLYENYAIATLC